MKNKIGFLIILLGTLLALGCKKTEGITSTSEKIETAARSNIFPTSITVGPDATYFKLDSVCLCGYSAYLNTCGVSPEYEAPNKGSEIYQISGPTQARISWKVVNMKSEPQAANLTTGVYKFVGHAWVTGYRACDDSLMNDNVYDTVTITITKNRKSIK